MNILLSLFHTLLNVKILLRHWLCWSQHHQKQSWTLFISNDAVKCPRNSCVKWWCQWVENKKGPVHSSEACTFTKKWSALIKPDPDGLLSYRLIRIWSDGLAFNFPHNPTSNKTSADTSTIFHFLVSRVTQVRVSANRLHRQISVMSCIYLAEVSVTSYTFFSWDLS